MAAQSSSPAASSSTIKSSFTFPARPSQQQQQFQYASSSTSIAPYVASASPLCSPYIPNQQNQEEEHYTHVQSNSISALSRKSSCSSGDPFAYDRASLRTTLTTGGHTPRSSISSLKVNQSSACTTSSHALSSTVGGDRNKELPPQPEGSPVKHPAASTTHVKVTQEEALSPTPVVAEYVQALHDYTAAPTSGSANICLSFQTGDFIKVLNRDSSGWWDGEINGTRGWFPSNYVAQAVYDTSTLPSYANARFDLRNVNAIASTSSEPMQRAATTPATMMSQRNFSSNEYRPETPAFDSSRRPSSQDNVTSAVIHAIHLMQTAVDANRTSHFRPASSCFVVAVKAILLATDTLARDSVILRTHLVLARQRKQILSNLANVMTLARNASADNMDAVSRARDTGLMLKTAHMALSNVENFLQIAVQCGVEIPNRIETVLDDRQTQRISNLQYVSTPNLDACLQFPLSSNDTAESDLSYLSAHPKNGAFSAGMHRPTPSSSSNGSTKSLHKTRSLSDMKKVSKRKMSEASNASSAASSSNSAGAHNVSAAQAYAFLGKPPSSSEVPRRPVHQNQRRPSIPAAYAAAMPAQVWQANESISSSTSSLGSSQGPTTPVDANAPQQPTEVYRTLTLIHDQLLSTIAAFVGHVHAHSRTSHSSSYAHLIDMTRDTIERVRETLLIVDVIIAHPALSGFTRDLKYLTKYREALYLATTALVTAARKATAPLSTEPADDSLIHDQEEDEKQELLKAATGVLRASADCVNSTKPLLLRRRGSDAAFVIDLLHTPSSEIKRNSCGSTGDPTDEDDTTVQVTDSGIGSEDSTHMGGNRDGDKARHTVSMLGRKATSLSCMRDANQLGDDLADASLDCVEELTGDEYEDADESQQARLPADLEGLWNQQQQRPGSQSLPGSTRNSIQLSQTEASQAGQRSSSSLSTRRGVPIPANLTIQTRYNVLKARPPSSGAMSATSTVTSIPGEKNAYPASHVRPATPLAGPLSAASVSLASSESCMAGGEAMSRDESSRGSAASNATSSYHSNTSDANTADTSPRSSLACPSPADDQADWLHTDANGKRPSRTEAYRARSGSTPDRVAALRISEGASGPFSPLSPRSPNVASPTEKLANKNWLLERDYEPKECSFNADGNVTGGTIKCLVERMTLHDQTIDANFSTAFFLTFRMFTTPTELMNHLFVRFNMTPPSHANLSEVELKIWREQKVTPVRLRIYNFFKTWLESHWRPSSDCEILETLLCFTRESMMPVMPLAAQRLIDLLLKRSVGSQSTDGGRTKTLARMASTDKLKAARPTVDGVSLGSATFPGPGSVLPPSPIVSKSLLNVLRTPPYAPNTILDFDPLELARQFTILESRLYCAILPEDLIGQEFGKKGSNRSVNIRAMSSLSTRITGWIAEIILSEQDAKKRSGLVKYFIKLGDNYNTLMAILAALNSSTIARLKKTWDGLSNKHKATLETLRKTTEHSRNYAQYRATIRAAVAPCLPFLGLTLTDLTFCQDGNAAERSSPLDSSLRLINFDRYQRIAKIINDVQRFQVPYNLIEVPGIQNFLQIALRNIQHGGDPQALYRRSLVGHTKPFLGTGLTASHNTDGRTARANN